MELPNQLSLLLPATDHGIFSLSVSWCEYIQQMTSDLQKKTRKQVAQLLLTIVSVYNFTAYTPYYKQLID